MLLSLTIRNIALMDEMQVEFDSGLHVFTGETGAGKSILVDSIALLLGGRAQKELIRTGCDKARVEGLFDLADCPAARALLQEQGLAQEDAENELVLAREITAQGRSACRVNGALTPLSQYQQLTGLLMDIHGQHEHQHPEIAAQWLDFFVSKEGTTIIQKGFEGRQYEIVDEPAISGAEKSMKVFKLENTVQNETWGNKTVPERVTPEIYYGVPAVAGSQDVALYEGGKAYIPFEAWTGFPLTSWASDADMQAEISELTSLLNEYVAQSVAEFVTGGRDINDDAQWNSYVDELRAMGMDRLVELTQQVNFGK